MAIKDWPAEERPREKLLQRGAQALSDAELVATSNKPLKQVKTNKFIDYFPNLTVLRI